MVSKTHNYVVIVEVVMCTVQKEKSFTFFLLSSSLCSLLWMDCVQHIKVIIRSNR
ncbi:hypothetical protein MtrunA17_Chr7g0230751 [Medicago truncatula]|uniref:Uncharacterized protein n=1 Tax=Medicago truncatula TaxID=3880 RepID=A0A396GY54_MEDTR|nr:hypothetical protein MtrunA17_Chr7g0230751 [Medicago truncatula]